MTTTLTRAALLLVLSAAPAAATPITGISWDGNPPGNLSQLTGVLDFYIGVPAFSPGTYTLTVDGGITAWWDQNRIGLRIGPAEYLVPGALLTTTIFTVTQPWTLTATTPSFIGGESTSPQWAFWQTAPNALGWGLEDIQLPGGDIDYQDAYGTLTRRGGTIDLHTHAPVPEPTTWTLLGLGLVALAWRKLTRA
jgi:hypothetical protein